MKLPTLLTGLGCGAASGLMLRMAKQELAAKRMAGNLNLTPIGNIQPGLCLTAGEVVCEKSLVTPYSQTPAAWYRFNATERGLQDTDYHRKSPFYSGKNGLACERPLLPGQPRYPKIRAGGFASHSFERFAFSVSTKS